MTIRVYGIPNCDTVKKARAWLTEAGVDYAFHDYKRDGADPETLAQWTRSVGWEALLNAPEPRSASSTTPTASISTRRRRSR